MKHEVLNFESAPPFVNKRLVYLTKMGSIAYGCNTPTSDTDYYGVCVPPLSYLNPYGLGKSDFILGFGTQPPKFEQYQSMGVGQGNHAVVDVTVFSVIKFFELCKNNNPNIIDALFTPDDCLEYCHPAFKHVRDNRRLFLSKLAIPKFVGYATSQMHKMQIKTVEPGHKRYEGIQRLGYDSKYALHLIRLLCEAEQILAEGDLDLRRNAKLLKQIRSGHYSLDELHSMFTEKLEVLNSTPHDASLPDVPDEQKLKEMLLECIHSIGEES